MIQKTKPFKAVSMPCTKEQFEKELKPILEFLGEEVHWGCYGIYPNALFFTNNYNGCNGLCSNTYSEISVYRGNAYVDKFCLKAFIEALGYDYSQVLKGMGKNDNLHSSTEYIILRPILWFYKDQKVAVADLEKYFTEKAMDSLIESNFIKKGNEN